MTIEDVEKDTNEESGFGKNCLWKACNRTWEALVQLIDFPAKQRVKNEGQHWFSSNSDNPKNNHFLN